MTGSLTVDSSTTLPPPSKKSFRTFEEVTKVTLDPDFQAMQQEEEPWVSKHHIVTSLGWVETFVQDGKVVNIQDGKSTFPEFAAMTDLSSLTGGGAQQ